MKNQKIELDQLFCKILAHVHWMHQIIGGLWLDWRCQ